MTDTAQYACQGLHKQFEKGRSSGSISISPAHLDINIKGERIHLSYDGLEISHGGANDRLIFLAHPSKPDWRFYTSDRSILKNPILRQQPSLAASINRARSKRQMSWLLMAAVVVVCIATPIGLLSNLDLASKYLAQQVPVEWEEQLGESSFDQYSLQIELMDKKQAEALLEPLIEPLLIALPERKYDYQFHISNDTSLNAFALPGGVVVINAGLIMAAEDASEMLGVVGHEISHVREQHGIRNVISSAGTYLIISAVLGDASGLIGVVADAAPLLINQGYSRKFEAEADDKGFDILVAADIDPRGLAVFFEKLIEKEKKMLEKVEDQEQREWLQAGLGFLSSHPATEDRVVAIRERANAVEGPFIDQSLDYAQLKAAVEQFVIENPDSNTDAEPEASEQEKPEQEDIGQELSQ